MKSLHAMRHTASPPTEALKDLLKKFRGDLVLVIHNEANVNLGRISRSRRKPLLGVRGSFRMDVSIRKISTVHGHVNFSDGRWDWVDRPIIIPLLDFWRITQRSNDSIRMKSVVKDVAESRIFFIFGARAVSEYCAKKKLDFKEAFSILGDH